MEKIRYTIDVPKTLNKHFLDAINTIANNYVVVASSLDSVEILEKKIEAIKDFIADKRSFIQENAIQSALVYLHQCCDGANARDGSGFNKPDSNIGKSLAKQIMSGKNLTPEQAKYALNMLKKYKKQLEEAEIFLPDWDEEEIKTMFSPLPEIEIITKEVIKNTYNIFAKNGLITCSFDYDSDLVNIMRAIRQEYPKARFNGESKSWVLPIASKESLLSYEEIKCLTIDHDSLEKEWKKYQEKEEAKQKELQEKAESKAGAITKIIEIASLEKPIGNGWHLFNHQVEAVKWLVTRLRDTSLYNGGILADDMGLGKTISSLVAAKAVWQYYRNQDTICNIFVVCPASLKQNWLKEADIVGVGIEVFSWAKLPQPLESQKYLIIADEAHYMQNLSSKRTKNMLKLTGNKNCLGGWLLTGTPLKNGLPINLFPLLLSCNHSLCELPTLTYGTGVGFWYPLEDCQNFLRGTIS